MPNWCSNELTIMGKGAQAVLTAIKGEDSCFDFNKLVPYPDDYRRLDQQAREYESTHAGDRDNRPKDGFNNGGYEWCVQHWGTKWNADEAKMVSSGDDNATILFFTAWSPPLPIIEALTKLFPELVFTLCFSEYYSAYRGKFIASGGTSTMVEFDNTWNPFDEDDQETK